MGSGKIWDLTFVLTSHAHFTQSAMTSFGIEKFRNIRVSRNTVRPASDKVEPFTCPDPETMYTDSRKQLGYMDRLSSPSLKRLHHLITYS